MNPLNKRLHKGEAAAFAEFYDQLGEKLFQYVYTRVGSSSDATDVVQEVFVRLVKSHRTLARANNLNGYVFAVARNETIRWLKKNKRHEARSLDENTTDHSKNNSSARIDSDDWIASILDTLTPIDREIVQLKVISKLTFVEIAAAIEMPQSNVATRYRRAITKLQTQLTDENQNTVQKQ